MRENQTQHEHRKEQKEAAALKEFKEFWPDAENEKGYVDGMAHFTTYDWDVIHQLVYAAYSFGFKRGWEDCHTL